MDDIIVASYYSEGETPSFCYTINSLWLNPKKEIQKIKKSERLELVFYNDISEREKNPPMDLHQRPKFNYISNPGVQVAVHSPYEMTSPFSIGVGLEGGKSYEIKLKQDEKHLLPAPYQTNCTDYIATWRARGGIGPTSQITVLEECKYNMSLEQFGCVPFNVDYPHNDSVCGHCGDREKCSTGNFTNYCTSLLRNYNQPCDSYQYTMEVREKLVNIERSMKLVRGWQAEKFITKRKGYECGAPTDQWKRRCQTVLVEIVFTDFEITNLTYNAKIESLGVFSVIGGYMGMYLGISLLTIYDFAEIAVVACWAFRKKAIKKRKNQTKTYEKNQQVSRRQEFFRHKQLSRKSFGHNRLTYY